MSGKHSAFFYGTLMAPEVFFTVCLPPGIDRATLDKMYTFTPAVLEDHCRHRVRGADYPGVIREAGKSVLGVYATGLTDANLKRLDYFEGAEYDRVRVRVRLVGRGGAGTGGEQRETSVYLFNQPDGLELGEWDFEHFRKEKMRLWTRGEYAFAGCDSHANVIGDSSTLEEEEDGEEKASDDEPTPEAESDASEEKTAKK